MVIVIKYSYFLIVVQILEIGMKDGSMDPSIGISYEQNQIQHEN